MKPFRRSPRDDSPSLRETYSHPDKGEHAFFRHALLPMRRRFVELTADTPLPDAFLHGNPHLANYVRSHRGAAMVDFDRSRRGPYGWDIVRFLLSLSLRRDEDEDDSFLARTALDGFRRGYTLGLHCPDLGWEGMSHLLEKDARAWQASTEALVEAGKRWGKRLRKHAVEPTCRMRALLDSYLDSQADGGKLRQKYELAETARVAGSQGKLHHLFLLVPHKRKGRDYVLIDVKQTYPEQPEPGFDNQFAHQGQRMVAAGDLHAPDWEARPGWATHRGEQFWGRQIPPRADKLRRRLSEPEQIEIAYSVGNQLGRAHGLSAAGGGPVLFTHFDDHYDDLVELAQRFRDEIRAAHRRYLRKQAA